MEVGAHSSQCDCAPGQGWGQPGKPDGVMRGHNIWYHGGGWGWYAVRAVGCVRVCVCFNGAHDSSWSLCCGNFTAGQSWDKRGRWGVVWCLTLGGVIDKIEGKPIVQRLRPGSGVGSAG